MKLMADDKWGEEDDRDRTKVDVVTDTICLVDGHLEEPLCWGHKFLHNFENRSRWGMMGVRVGEHTPKM